MEMENGKMRMGNREMGMENKMKMEMGKWKNGMEMEIDLFTHRTP